MTKTLIWLSTCLEIFLAMALVYLCDFGLIAPHSEHARRATKIMLAR